jgi:hypothetical protein
MNGYQEKRKFVRVLDVDLSGGIEKKRNKNWKDLSGQIFERLRVIKLISFDENYHSKYICKCQCGCIIVVSGNSLISKNTKSCGCYKKDNPSNFKGMVKKNKIPLYESYSSQLSPFEEIRRIRFTKRGVKNLQTKCFNCGKWFYPNLDQICRRIRCINGTAVGESHLYCSDDCKWTCSIFRKIKYPDGFNKKLNRPYIDPDWREMVLARADYKCEKCGSPDNLHAHHIQSATLNPILANDLDNGMCVCKDCHKILHSENRCRTIDLRCD